MRAVLKHKLPPARAGQAIGLVGGSFDPAHGGHVHLTREALKRFGFDQIWWLVSPGNPLKSRGPAAMEARMTRARQVMDHPKVRITDIEAHFGTTVTADTLFQLLPRYPGVRFTWVMGADNLTQFHRWGAWQDIAASVRIAVMARPGDRLAARTSPAARAMAAAKLHNRALRTLARSDAPAWAFVNMPMRKISSTELRASGDWQKALS